MRKISRRNFIVGGSAVVAVAAVAVTSSILSSNSDTIGPYIAAGADISKPVDMTTWFSAPDKIAILGVSVLGATTGVACGDSAAEYPQTVEEYQSRILEEEKCSTLQQVGGWFLTPTEVLVAQQLASA